MSRFLRIDIVRTTRAHKLATSLFVSCHGNADNRLIDRQNSYPRPETCNSQKSKTTLLAETSTENYNSYHGNDYIKARKMAATSIIAQNIISV